MPDKQVHLGTFLADISDRDKPWDEHRKNATVVQQLYEKGGELQYSERMKGCCRWLGFVLDSQDPNEMRLKLQQAQFCRVRHCPVCQWRRSLKWKARFLTALPKITAAYPKHRWLFLTLTIRNPPIDELRATIQQMNQAWHRLSRLKAFPAIGFAKSIEVTRPGADFAHPHMHVMLLVPASYFGAGYIKQSEWKRLWREALRIDYDPVVDIRAVKPKTGADLETSVQSAIVETMKYSVKEDDLLTDATWLVELTKQLHKTRAVSVGGVLRKFISEEEPTDLIHDEAEAGILVLESELWFQWHQLAYRYVKSERRPASSPETEWKKHDIANINYSDIE